MHINPFAGLMAGFRGVRAEDPPSEDEEARKARRAEEDQKREEEDARRAEEDNRRKEEDARRAEEDGTEPRGNDEGQGTKADKEQDSEADAEDDDADAEEGMDDKEAKAFRRGLAIGRARENVRSSRIFLNASTNGGRPDLAATLAFTTRNSSAEAARILGSAGPAQPARGRTLDNRMANRTEARPGAGGGAPSGKTSFADRVAAAVKKAGR